MGRGATSPERQQRDVPCTAPSGLVADRPASSIDKENSSSCLASYYPPPRSAHFRRLAGILDEVGVCYQFTGGFAGNLHGSGWPLHDLDVDVARADLPRVVELLRPYTTWPLSLYVDDEFELQLLRAEMEGVAIDISQAEEAYARVGGQRVPLGTSLLDRQRVSVLDLEVWVQPLRELIAYKELLGRRADVANLRALQARLAGKAGA